MPTIIFTTPDGKQHDVSVDDGVTVMEAGRDANLGIEGTCGGCLSCATCWIWLLALQRPRALDARSKCRMRLMGCV